jgi:hypothetical protein
VQKINAIVNAFLRSDSAKKQLAALHATRRRAPDHLRALVPSDYNRIGHLFESISLCYRDQSNNFR